LAMYVLFRHANTPYVVNISQIDTDGSVLHEWDIYDLTETPERLFPGVIMGNFLRVLTPAEMDEFVGNIARTSNFMVRYKNSNIDFFSLVETGRATAFLQGFITVCRAFGEDYRQYIVSSIYYYDDEHEVHEYVIEE